VMVATLDNIRFIIYDLKYSWYFRAWAVLWFIGFIIGFSALIILSGRSNEAGSEQDVRIRIENVPSLNFPRYHIRISSSVLGTTIKGKYCTHNGFGVSTSKCEAIDGIDPTGDVCFAVQGDSIVAYNKQDAPFKEKRIECFINTTVSTDGKSGLLAWGLENFGNTKPVGHNAYSDVYIAPNNNAWVLLTPINVMISGTKYHEWETNLLYHSSLSQQGYYKIDTILSTFYVRDADQVDSYNGYRALGDIGGFAYFAIILHTIVMLVFGFCLRNNSKFLGGDVSGH